MQNAEKTEFLSGGPVYGLLALFLPLFFLGAAVFLITAVVSLPVFRVLASGFASALLAAVYYDLLRNRLVNHTAAHIRGGVIITALAYIIVSLCAVSAPLSVRFFPGLANLCAALASLYTWAMALILKQVFRGQRQFEIFTETLKGEELRAAIVNNPELINIERIGKLKKTLLVQLGAVGLLALAVIFSKTAVVLPLLAFLLFITAGSVCSLGLFALMKQEYAFAGEGLSISKSFRLRHILGIALFTIGCALSAVLLASNRSLLPLSLITRFFAWIISLFSKLAPNADTSVLPLPPPPPPPLAMGEQLAEDFGVTEPWSGWKHIQRGLIALAVLGFLFFMIKPLFEGGLSLSKGKKSLKKIWKEFSEWLAGLKNWKKICSSLVSFFKGGKGKRIRRRNGDISRVSEEVFAAYTPAKKKKVLQSVNLFARLIIWGDETLNVKWKPSLAPGEFCALLRSAPAIKQETGLAALRCGALFEQSLYSQNELTAAEEEEFKTLVETITAEGEMDTMVMESQG